jgi:hypothetical protein
MGEIEKQVKNIEEKKRLQSLAGIQLENKNKSIEEQWVNLQKEMENMLNLVREYGKNK